MKRTLYGLLVLLLGVAGVDARTKDVEVWVGETVDIPITRTKVVAKTMMAHSEDPKVASAKWGGADNGPVGITGLAEGQTLVKVYGQAVKVSVGIKTRMDNNPLTSQPVAGEMLVTVHEPTRDKRVIMIDMGQKMSIYLPRKARIREIQEGDRSIATVRRTLLSRIEVHGVKPGMTTATVKYFVPKIGKQPEQRVEGTLQIHVSEKRAKEKRIKEQWTSLGSVLGVVIVDEDVSMDLPSASEPIGYTPCGESGITPYASLNVGGLFGDDIIGNGWGLDVGVRVPLKRLIGSDLLGGYGNALYLAGGLGTRMFSSSDNYIDDVTGWSVFGGLGMDLYFLQSFLGGGCWGFRNPLPVCWGWGAEGLLEYTLLTANGYHNEESAGSFGFRFKTGPRLRFRDSGWNMQLNGGGSVHLTDYDFGYNTDTGRFGYQLDFSVGYGF